jgi:ubiquinone/menaquinone biosynthesis C-methylase UbiE
MREEWNERARENAEYFIASGQEAWDRREFFRSGEINVANELLPDMPCICGGARSPFDLNVLEIGCGVGRMTQALSRIFDHVTAVDVSPEMIKRAQANLKHLTSVDLVLGDGATLLQLDDESYDFAFSFIVFQHIPAMEVIRSYCREVYRVLRGGGVFKFQVSGSPGERLDEPTTWFGVWLSESDVERLAEATGFELEASHGAGTQYYWLYFRKPAVKLD